MNARISNSPVSGARRELGITQQELADVCGVSLSLIKSIENKDRINRVSQKMANRLFLRFGLDRKAISEETGPPLAWDGEPYTASKYEEWKNSVVSTFTSAPSNVLKSVLIDEIERIVVQSFNVIGPHTDLRYAVVAAFLESLSNQALDSGLIEFDPGLQDTILHVSKKVKAATDDQK